MGDAIKVCIRCRPFNKRELEMGPPDEQLCVNMPINTQVEIFDPAKQGSGGHDECANSYAYDRCFWSVVGQDSFELASQQTLQEEIGSELLNNTMKGFNNTLFAYGQTGAGKTWSVIGGSDIRGDDAGLLPRLIVNMFTQLATPEMSEWSNHVTVSYLEIYNERLRDLLKPQGGNTKASPVAAKKGPSDKKDPEELEIRQHPTLGVFVPGLTEAAATDAEAVMGMLDFGFNNRAVAETSMNPRSSRSHTVFVIAVILFQGKFEKPTKQLTSKINMVDLAGSERQKKTNAEGDKLKEGAAINQSLTNLALVIHSLAAQCTGKAKKGKGEHVPFRNSKLTHFLQPALSGNSKTVMIAAISPSSNNIQETLSTLRFANSAKEIKTKATSNAATNMSVVDQLKEQIKTLQKQLATGGSGTAGPGGEPAAIDEDVKQQIAELKALREKYGESFEKSLARGELIQSQQQEALKAMGLGPPDDPMAPSLKSISADPTLNGKMTYYLPTNGNEVNVGSDKGECTIVLEGLGIPKQLIALSNKGDAINAKLLPMTEEEAAASGNLAEVYRNGARLFADATAGAEATLNHGDRLFLGKAFAFKVFVPSAAARKEADLEEVDHEFAEMVAELIDTHSEQYLQTEDFTTALIPLIGKENAEKFLKNFSRCLPLVQEANQISAAVRPLDRILLRLDVLLDPQSFRGISPAMCVRLYKTAPPQQQAEGADNVQREFAVHADGLMAEDRDDIFQDAVVDGKPAVELAVFSWHSFLVRLHGMREAYDDFKTGKVHDWRMEADPWTEYSYLDHRDMAGEMNVMNHARESVEGHLATAVKGIEQGRGRSIIADIYGTDDKRKSQTDKKVVNGSWSVEAISSMSHEERNVHAQVLFHRLRESLSVLRQELEIDEEGK
ncbi:unnamed protein product [Amoebophrya sp. A25]|nr:unnamed protein product [Amoebophrya sp. A25]|eukprot:GSA25T00023551001.1